MLWAIKTVSLLLKRLFIYPSNSLTFDVLNFLYGKKLKGNYSQYIALSYFSFIKQIFIHSIYLDKVKSIRCNIQLDPFSHSHTTWQYSTHQTSCNKLDNIFYPEWRNEIHAKSQYMCFFLFDRFYNYFIRLHESYENIQKASYPSLSELTWKNWASSKHENSQPRIFYVYQLQGLTYHKLYVWSSFL